MKLSVSERIAAPRADVFRDLTDFDRLLGARGEGHARIERLDHPAPVAIGSTWRGAFDLHGFHRTGTARMVALDPPDSYRLEISADGLSALLRVALSDCGDGRTGICVTLDLSPTSMTGRVMVHSLHLVRVGVQRRIQKRLARFAREVEARGA